VPETRNQLTGMADNRSWRNVAVVRHQTDRQNKVERTTAGGSWR
jgi:hypothetical protein